MCPALCSPSTGACRICWGPGNSRPPCHRTRIECYSLRLSRISPGLSTVSFEAIATVAIANFAIAISMAVKALCLQGVGVLYPFKDPSRCSARASHQSFTCECCRSAERMSFSRLGSNCLILLHNRNYYLSASQKIRPQMGSSIKLLPANPPTSKVLLSFG